MANNTKIATPKTQESKAEAAANRKPIHEIRMGESKLLSGRTRPTTASATMSQLAVSTRTEVTGNRPKASAATTCRS